jgi:hypothetical protein
MKMSIKGEFGGEKRDKMVCNELHPGRDIYRWSGDETYDFLHLFYLFRL